jgi:signal transduction histidine kinase
MKAPSIRALLLGAHAFLFLVPLALVAVLRVYDVYLLRQTEHQLIAESVMAGEFYRAAYLRAAGRNADDHRPPGETPAGSTLSAAPFSPVGARIDFATPVLPRERTDFPHAHGHPPFSEQAGHEIEALLLRAQTFNLSALRVLDAQGCVVASTRTQRGLCLSDLPEVRDALAGRYGAVLRERISDEPEPAFGDIRRRGKVRVFTALPVWSDGKVIGVVRASRTGLDALSSLWVNRRGLVWLTVGCTLLLFAVSFTFAAAIARPIGRLTQAAQRVARGEDVRALALPGTAPREIAVLQDVLFQMASQLATRAGYVRAFAQEVSHELKTPITAIRGAAELLEQGDMPEPDQRRFLGNIVEDAQRMERLVTRLLELARHENAPAAPVPNIDPRAHAATLLARYGDRVKLHVSQDVGPLALAPEQLDAVLTNLVENALRHGAGQSVAVSMRREGSQLLIAVRDRGAGVSEANRKRLFERFFTTERDRGGTGLGLAIVRAIAEARNGSVAARFDQDGTEFSVRL